MPDRPNAYINGLGSHLPEKVLSNQDLEKLVETKDDWILERTGIKERRIASNEEFPSTMGIEATKKALAAAKILPESIDLILVATMTPDYISPSTAAIIQSAIGAVNAAAMDIQAACTGFIYGLSIAKAFIESGIYKRILLIASEKMSSFVDYTDRGTCILFGDGACAAVISDEANGFLIDAMSLGADGRLADLLIIPAGGSKQSASPESIKEKLHYIKMEGKTVFKHAVRRMVLSSKESLARAGLTEKEISWVVPHQANLRIMEATAKGLNVSMDRVFKTVHKYGNTSASGVAIALEELSRERPISKGEHLLLVAFGAGLTWGSAILTKTEAG